MEIKKEFVVSAQAQTGREKYQTIISSGNHNIIVDEPVTNGGADTGPDPYGLLLASLGSCTAITLRMYIDRKMWPVDKIMVTTELFRVNDGILIQRQLSFNGDLSDLQKTRLVTIADACPISKILTGRIIIETNLA